MMGEGDEEMESLATASMHTERDATDTVDPALADLLIARLASVTARRSLWDRVRPIRYGSGITSFAEFNLLVQALGRASTLRRMVTPRNVDRVRDFVRAS